MISHKHKVIFIHIPKCAGSSVEAAFGGLPEQGNWTKPNYHTLMGWCPENNLHLQHATPQELLDNQLITTDIWNSYYKFIIIRNPYDRALSDYKYLIQKEGLRGHFSDYILGKGRFEHMMNDQSSFSYRGDHLRPMTDYVQLNGNPIDYNCIIRFEDIGTDLQRLCRDLQLPKDFFNQKVNPSKQLFSHYSKFYNTQRKQLVEQQFGADLTQFNYRFTDKKNALDRLIARLPAYFLVSI